MIKKLSILVAAVFMLSLGAVACGDDDNGNGGNGGNGGTGGVGGSTGGTGGNDGGTDGNDGGTGGNDGGTDGNDGGTGGTDEGTGGTGGTDEGTGGTGGTEGEEPVDATCDDFCTQATACGQDIAWDDHADCMDECTESPLIYNQDVLNCVAEIDCVETEDATAEFNSCLGL